MELCEDNRTGGRRAEDKGKRYYIRDQDGKNATFPEVFFAKKIHQATTIKKNSKPAELLEEFARTFML